MADALASGREHLHDLLTAFDHGMLVTRANTGGLRARPMAVAEIDSTGDLWFATSGHSGKIDDVQFDPQVCVTFQDDGRYLSLTGEAQFVDDRPRIKQLWREAWRPWFPQGEEDPALVLLRISLNSGEFWDRAGLAGVQYVLEAARARIAGRQMQTSSQLHQRVDL
jgi:general stress protein 26